MELITQILLFLTEPWFLMILIASLMFATGSYLDEHLLAKHEQPIGVLVIVSGLFGIVLMVVFTLLALWNNVTLWLSVGLILQAVLIGVFELLWVIPYLYATKRRGAVVAAPLFQLVPVFALALEATLGTIPPTIQIVGATLLIIGGILISLEQNEEADGSTHHKVDWVTVLLMMLSVLLIALIYVLFRDASLETSYIGVGFWTSIGMITAAVLIWLLWAPFRRDFNVFCANASGRSIGLQLFNECMDSGGAYITHLANTLGPSVMVVTAFNATQPIVIGCIATAMAWFGYTTTSTKPRSTLLWFCMLIAVILIATGAILVALGV